MGQATGRHHVQRTSDGLRVKGFKQEKTSKSSKDAVNVVLDDHRSAHPPGRRRFRLNESDPGGSGRVGDQSLGFSRAPWRYLEVEFHGVYEVKISTDGNWLAHGK